MGKWASSKASGGSSSRRYTRLQLTPKSTRVSRPMPSCATEVWASAMSHGTRLKGTKSISDQRTRSSSSRGGRSTLATKAKVELTC